MLPRLQTMSGFLTTGAGMEARGGSGGGGGQFLKGAGESQIEMDRRLFRKQLSKIEADIEEVAKARRLYREKRQQRDNLPIVAIVGYTNAGKSSLLNKLCGQAEVYADDLLFATLDPTVRKVALPGGKEVLFSDTVGFIQKLPTKLVSSFRATLDELEDASLILHVVDSASPLAQQHISSVVRIVDDVLGASDRPNGQLTPQILVLNKCDALVENTSEFQKGRVDLNVDDWADLYQLDSLTTSPAATVRTSALDGTGLDNLLSVIEELLAERLEEVECRIPYSAGDLLADIRKSGTVVEESYGPSGTQLVAFVPPSLSNKLQLAGFARKRA